MVTRLAMPRLLLVALQVNDEVVVEADDQYRGRCSMNLYRILRPVEEFTLTGDLRTTTWHGEDSKPTLLVHAQ